VEILTGETEFSQNLLRKAMVQKGLFSRDGDDNDDDEIIKC
jgi:hypothetical protein